MESKIPLKELCNLIADCPHSTPIWTERGRVVLRSHNIKNGRLDLDNVSYTDESHYKQRIKRAKPQFGDIIITREAPMGEVCQIPKNLTCCLGQRMVLLRPNPARCSARYLLFALQSDVVQHEIKVNEGTGSTVSNLRIPILENLRIPCTTLAQQQAIACILGALDDKIELNRRMNRTLEEMARALFRSWFIDFDPVRAKAAGQHPPGLKSEIAALFPDSFEDSELGEIPKGWRVTTFSELTTLITKGTTPTQGDVNRAPETDVKINYVRVNCIEEDGLILADKLTSIPESVHAGVLKRSILKCGDILYTIAGTIGRIALTEDWILPANTNQAVAIIRPNPSMPPGFLILTMRQDAFRQELHNNIVHAVQANLSLGMLSKAQAVVPLLPTLPRLFAPVEAIQSKIINNRTQSRSLAALRDTLLPKLISGELRVSDAERIAARCV